MSRKVEDRLGAVEERLELLEREVSNYLRQLNRVLNGLTSVNQRLAKEGSEPKAQPSPQTILNRIVELEDELGVCKAGMEELRKEVGALGVSSQEFYVNNPPPGVCHCGCDTMRMESSTAGWRYVCTNCRAVRGE